VLPLPAEPPDAPVWTGAIQLKVVPLTELLKEIPVVLPEQIDWEEGVAVTLGTGLTFTVTVTVFPGHPFALGVTV
jgi:hypothetical protein